MKNTLLRALTVVVASAGAASAQFDMPGSPAGINAALVKLFGDVKAFSAKSDVRVLDKDLKEKISAPMDFALLDGQMRVEVDMARMKNQALPAGAAASMQQLGMDRVVSIIRPDKKTSYFVFPNVQAYAALPLSSQEVDAYTRHPKITKTALGKETLDGHPCVKNQVVLTDDQGGKHEATVWNATDLKDFPVQIQTQEKGDTVILRYRQIQLARPDAKQFEPPAGFKAHDDMASLLQGAMLKAINSGVTLPQ